MDHPLIQTLRSAVRRLLPAHDTDAVLEVDAELARISIDDIERLVDGPIHDLSLYEQALVHRSLLRGQPNSHLLSNERLEFLGDAVLGFVVAEHLYRHFPQKTEGFLTRLRAKLVNGSTLARFARELDLGAVVLMSDNMVGSGGRENETILADAFEAVIGALYLDQGLEAARSFIRHAILDKVDLAELAGRQDNYKSLLLEFAQARGWPQPEYRIVAEAGPSHEKTFTSEVLVKGDPYGLGKAKSKKGAEQRAAREALEQLRDEERDEG